MMFNSERILVMITGARDFTGGAALRINHVDSLLHRTPCNWAVSFFRRSRCLFLNKGVGGD